MDDFQSIVYPGRSYLPHPMIIFALTAVLVLTAAAGTIALFHAVKHAPEGYENESGFHERVESKPVSVIATGTFSGHKPDSGWAA